MCDYLKTRQFIKMNDSLICLDFSLELVMYLLFKAKVKVKQSKSKLKAKVKHFQ